MLARPASRNIKQWLDPSCMQCSVRVSISHMRFNNSHNAIQTRRMGIPRLPNESSGTSRVPRHGPHIRTKPRHGHHHTNPRIVPRSRQRQKSISGYVFILAGSPISWQAKKQTTVAQSTVEAEYAAKEVTWLQYLLRDLGISKNEPKILHCDNQGAISLAKNPMHHAKTKPVDMQLYLI